MAGLDCSEISAGAWPTLRAGIHGTITVEDAEAHAAMRDLAAAGLAIGDSGAAPLAALRRLATDPEARALRDALAVTPTTRAAPDRDRGADGSGALRADRRARDRLGRRGLLVAAAGADFSATGSSTKNVEPSPSTDSTHTLPSKRRTSSRTM